MILGIKGFISHEGEKNMPTKMKKVNQPRTKARIDARLDKKLATYMAIAGAAGIGMLSTTAQAKIVYTPANAVTSYGTIPVDLNNAGVSAFTISVQGGFFHSEW